MNTVKCAVCRDIKYAPEPIPSGSKFICMSCFRSLPCPTTKPKEVEVERLSLSAADIITAFESSCNDNDALHALGFAMEKPKVKVDFWVNVYPSSSSHWYSTREVADAMAAYDRIACIHIEREVTEGEGIE